MNRKFNPSRLVLPLIIALLVGCSDDNTQCPESVYWLEVFPDSASVEVGHAVDIEARLCGSCESDIVWYVNSAPGGNAECGTITQTNPATYTAPDRVPYPATVLVMAVAEKDPSKADGCNITINLTEIHVNAETGNDTTGTGAVTHPVKTITRGLDLATPGVPIRVASGVYSQQTGEVFPILIGTGMSVVGEDWEETKIFADSAGIALQVEGDDCTLRRFCIDMLDNIYIKVTEASSGALIDSIMMPHVGLGQGIVVDGADGTVVSNCHLVCGMKCFCGWGIRLLGGDRGTVVRRSRFWGFYWGMDITSTSDAMIEHCDMHYNEHPVYLGCGDDPGDCPDPDLGGGARGSAGENKIRASWSFAELTPLDAVCGLTNDTPNTIYARNNIWLQYPPVEGSDFCNPGGGAVIW